MGQLKVVTLSVSELQKMYDEAAEKAIAKYRSEQVRSHDDLEMLSMSKIIASHKYGSRNTVAKLRNEIMNDPNVPENEIVVKQGSKYYFYINRFDAWFMKRKNIHEEALKVDPRLRGGS